MFDFSKFIAIKCRVSFAVIQSQEEDKCQTKLKVEFVLECRAAQGREGQVILSYLFLFANILLIYTYIISVCMSFYAIIM